MTEPNRPRRIVPLIVLAALVLVPGSLRSQPAEPVLVGLDATSGEIVPVDLVVVRRPGELRLDPSGVLTLTGGTPIPEGRLALLAFEPSTGALVPVELEVQRRSGEIGLDPARGELSATGIGSSPPSTGPTLVGFDPATRTLVPVELALLREPGTYALDVRAAVLSPVPGESALLGLEASSLVPVEVTVVRGRGGLIVDSRTGRVSPVAEAPGGPGSSLALLGIQPQAGGLIPVDLGPAYFAGVLAIDPASGRISSAGDAPVQDPRARGLTIIGVQTPTGALTRATVEPTRRPGEFAVSLSGTLEQVEPPPPPGEEGAFVFGGGLDLRQMLKLEDVLAEIDTGTTGPDATGIAPGVHGFIEYRWKAISFGLEGAYSKMNTEVRFPQGVQTGDLAYTEFGGNVKIHIPLEGPISPYGTFSIVRARTEADFEIEGQQESRTHTTKRDGIGGGIDYWASPHWGFRAEGVYSTTFEDGDAAEHVRWRAAVIFSPVGIRLRNNGR